MIWNNWARTAPCNPEAIIMPQTDAEVAEVLRSAAAQGKKMRVAGSGHSFTDLVKTNALIMDLRKLSGLVEVNPQQLRATAKAGTKLQHLTQLLHERGLAPENLGDIDVQTIAGAISTGTHGTGTAFGNLSTQVEAFKLVTAQGETMECSREKNPEIFQAGRVGLGALGVLTEVTLRLLPTYKLDYLCYVAPLEETLSKLNEYNAGHRNFEFYWFPYTDKAQLKFSDATDAPVKDPALSRFLNQHVVENNAAWALSQLGHYFPGTTEFVTNVFTKGISRVQKVNYAHKVYATPRNVRFKEMEYNIPIESFEKVFRAMKARMDERKYRIFFPWECRFVKGDDIWLSPAYGRDSAYIAIHCYYKHQDHERFFRDMEEIFLEHGGRPHWGKMHYLKAQELKKLYPHWDNFLKIRNTLDPNEMFINDYLGRLFYE